jgi:hypothetical protein
MDQLQPKTRIYLLASRYSSNSMSYFDHNAKHLQEMHPRKELKFPVELEQGVFEAKALLQLMLHCQKRHKAELPLTVS